MSDRLATAQWEDPAIVTQRYPFREGTFWLGRAEDGTGIGYRDDRHICLVSGTRGGKGTSIIINNLCLWPGSAVVVDPKGENATVTAARRGHGSEYCAGMGQAVHVLDPFNITQVEDRYRSRFNPLADLDPQREETIDEASRLANAIVVVKDDSRDPIWDESARTMVRGLILHVLTAKEFTDTERNLITVRNLISRGEWRVAEAIRELGHNDDKIDPPHLLLWRAMEVNPAFDGIVSGIGSRFRSMMVTAPKTFEGVLQTAAQHTEFLDSPGMRRTLAHSDFKMSDLKTKPEGMTLYLSLPQRHMDTHYRWLRMMVVLTCSEMEITRGQPATGHRVLIVLDEFAGLKRMAAIESAVAQLAGFGVKLFFVLQSLEQLKSTYKDAWETFLANAGLKVFFSIEDHFTQEYVSKLVGETEIIREVQSSNESLSENESRAQTASTSRTLGMSVTDSVSQSQSAGQSRSIQDVTRSVDRSIRGKQVDPAVLEIYAPRTGGFLQGPARSSWGITQSATKGTSASFGKTDSSTDGTSQTSTQGTSRTAGTGRSETVHRRPLIQPDEVGRIFARIDERNEPAYPGLALVIVAGTANPMVVRRVHYFEEPLFIECFSPHPDYEFIPPVLQSVDGIRPLIDRLESAAGGQKLTITKWFIEPGTVTNPGQSVAEIERVPPDNHPLSIMAPCAGKVSEIAASDKLPSGQLAIPDGPLFTLKAYPANGETVDPFQELRAACDFLNRGAPQNPVPTVAVPTRAPVPVAARLPARPVRKKWTIKQGLTFFASMLVLPGIAMFLMTRGSGDFLLTDVGIRIYIASFILGIILAWWIIESRNRKA